MVFDRTFEGTTHGVCDECLTRSFRASCRTRAAVAMTWPPCDDADSSTWEVQNEGLRGVMMLTHPPSSRALAWQSRTWVRIWFMGWDCITHATLGLASPKQQDECMAGWDGWVSPPRGKWEARR